LARSVNAHDVNCLHPVIGVDNRARLRCTVVDRHSKGIADQSRGLARIDRPSDYAASEGVQDDRAVHFALAGLDSVGRRNACGLCVF